MTEKLFLTEPYLKHVTGQVTAHTAEGAVVVDQTVFYAKGGGQPGDSGTISWDGNSLDIAAAFYADEGIALVPETAGPLPPIGSFVAQQLNWDRRHRHMRIHTGLHLLSVVIPLPVTGGAITVEKGRLDFDMPDAPEDKQALEDLLNQAIKRNLPVSEDWITQEKLDANPELVKTMSVKPPRGAGKVRLIRIGMGVDQIDLQPCGGTHVASTAEIGPVRIGKIEKKGKQNRRVNLHLID